ncbi:translocation/assembly module TamB domain-containing protein [Tabrizicola sp. BL-A-41-H6]|uniref:translocation/assembly module TamB domain-containing protein n=1 Tax=Tabrizicola sp. BL-A-41-H6 TaxID=3421107 RepID=UPI003D67BDF3
MHRALAVLLLSAVPVHAQDDGGGYLEAFLEQNLSGAGRNVSITGFAGAMSSVASVESITIADDEGVWITLNGIKLDWSRSALLSGEVVISELSAKEIIVARAPNTDSGTLAPEAQGFSLPELPVSIEIGRVAADRIVLDPALFGQAVEGSLEASLSLVGGEGNASLALIRNDSGPEGTITLDAAYSNADKNLSVNLLAAEGQNGLVTTLLNLPGAPAAELSVKGSGPFDDFAADVRLSTSGIDRLSGTVTTAAVDGQAYQLSADLSGDLAPLFLPDYAEFFGSEVALRLEATRLPTGQIDLQTFKVATQSLQLSGAVTLAPDGLPQKISVLGRIASPDGSPVLLPLSGLPTQVDEANLTVEFAPSSGEGWSSAVDIRGLKRPDLVVEHLSVNGSGRIGRTPAGRNFGANLTFAAEGIQPTDLNLAQAVGPAVTGRAVAHWLDGDGALSLPLVRIEGEGYAGKASLKVAGLKDAFLTSGQIDLTADDFSRFSGLARRPLGGTGNATLKGSASQLSGFFDIQGAFEGNGLKIGIAEVDRLLAEQSTTTLSVLRNEGGTVLRSFDLEAKSLSVTASGTLSSKASDLTANLTFADLGALGPGYRGRAEIAATFSGAPDAGVIRVNGTGSNLGVGDPQLDRLLQGKSQLSAALRLNEGMLEVEDARLANPQISLAATGAVTGAKRSITLDARLANLALLAPGFPGELRFGGTAEQDARGYVLDLRGKGPGQTDARVTGRLSKTFDDADIVISGGAQAALANVVLEPRAISGPVRFDLKLVGPLRLSSVSGRISLSGGRITDPDLGIALVRTEAIVDLAGGAARVSATSEPSTGGRVRLDGTVKLQSPFVADADIVLNRVRLVDPDLYQTFADGTLKITGPLAGGALISGRVNLSETEIRVPSTGFGGASGLPDLQHRAEPAAVQDTRRKAGMMGQASDGRQAQGSGAFRLDVELLAPNRVYVRGRGIDAELGGSLRLTGRSDAIVPAGEFTLIRGRLDILGKRLILSQGSMVLQGDFVPEINISASTESDGIVSFVTMNGPANQPQVEFTSNPELPQEEVLSRLLFGRGLDTISPLQAAQLANAVAVLAGRGGVGVIGRLRQGFGLDDLDLTTGEDGTASLRAGKYLSENVYTEVEVDQEGKSQINLNLDVRPGVTMKGRVGADGDTGIGIFVERDY